MMKRIDSAKLFAADKHWTQKRKYTGDDYIVHPIAVSELVAKYGGDLVTEDVIIAAILHDTVEDTDTTFEEITEKFGDTVAKYVWYLTDAPKFVGNRATRKALTRARLADAPVEVKLIKTMDIIHNSLSIKEHDPKFWETFKKETSALMEAMDSYEMDWIEIGW